MQLMAAQTIALTWIVDILIHLSSKSGL